MFLIAANDDLIQPEYMMAVYVVGGLVCVCCLALMAVGAATLLRRRK